MKSSNICLSIIIVNWNTIDMLSDCLESVFAGIVSLSAEVIVVDNGSTDGSSERIRRRFKDVTIIQNNKNLGFAKANNQAIEIAKGKYVLLLNSDTVILRDVLIQSVMFLKENPSVGAIGCRVLNQDGTLQPTCSGYPTIFNLLLLTSGLWKLPWPHFLDRYQLRHWTRTSEREVEVISGCFLMTRQIVIEEVGLLDEEFFFFGEETDWCKRAREKGWLMKFVPVGEIIHYGGGSVRKLNYQRDIMLSSATVKLHLKHGGKLSAILVMVLVCIFNVTRAAFWTLTNIISPTPNSNDRRNHFVQLVLNSKHIWPRLRTYRFEDD